MKKVSFLVAMIGCFIIAHGQNNALAPTKRFIEVTGTAETEIIPDEIYISITLRERYESKIKLTLEKQDDSLRKKLTLIGIDLKNLSLSNASSDYVKVHWRKKDALNSKDYLLKVATAEEVSKVFQAMGDLKINDASISKADHSKIEEFKKDLRIKAVKDAKDKATYMLAAIKEQTGQILHIVEIGVSENEDENDFRGAVRGGSWKDMSYYKRNSDQYEVMVSDSNGDSVTKYPEVDFQKIKLKYNVEAKFEIK